MYLMLTGRGPLTSCFSTAYLWTESKRANIAGVGESLTSVVPLVVEHIPVPTAESINEGCAAVEHIEGYPV